MSNFFTMGASILALVSLVNQAQAMSCAQSNAQTAEAGKPSELERRLSEAEDRGVSHKEARWEDKHYQRPAEVTRKLTETRERLSMLGSSVRLESRIESLEWDLAVTPRTLAEHAVKARELAFLRIELVRHRLAELAIQEDFFDRVDATVLPLPRPGLGPNDGISQVRVAMHQSRQQITTEIRAKAHELLDKLAEYRRENTQPEPPRLVRWAREWLGRPTEFDPYKIAEQMGFDVQGLRSRMNLISASIERFLNEGSVKDMVEDMVESRAYYGVDHPLTGLNSGVRRDHNHAWIPVISRERLRRAYLIAMIYGGYGDPSTAVLQRIRIDFRADRDERGVLTEARAARFSELWDGFGQYLADNGLLFSPYNVSNKSHLVFLESGRPNVLRIMGSAWDQSPYSLIRASTSRRDLRIGPFRILNSDPRRTQFVVDIELP